jgi:hypothetical protein
MREKELAMTSLSRGLLEAEDICTREDRTRYAFSSSSSALASIRSAVSKASVNQL